MTHPIYRVTACHVVGPTTLNVQFDDASVQTIDFAPVLYGALFGPLRDPVVFRQAHVDPEVHTVVWPNGADFDPATLHDWPTHVDALRTLASRWKQGAA